MSRSSRNGADPLGVIRWLPQAETLCGTMLLGKDAVQSWREMQLLTASVLPSEDAVQAWDAL